MRAPTALIAEDENILAQHLQQELARLWPELRIVAVAPHGAAAVDEAMKFWPDICFLDIRMPGLSGLEAAAALADEWPADRPFPLIVFVTAYEQYALHAFDHAAVDYLVKPLQPDRLAQTCGRLQAALAGRTKVSAGRGVGVDAMDSVVQQLRMVLDEVGVHSRQPTKAPSVPLRLLKVAVGDAVVMVAVDDVLYFEAADKYVRVITEQHDYLIRTSLRELIEQLDPQRFWQVQRGVVVRSDAIDRAIKDELGKVKIFLKHCKDILPVGRMYVHLFKGQ